MYTCSLRRWTKPHYHVGKTHPENDRSMLIWWKKIHAVTVRCSSSIKSLTLFLLFCCWFFCYCNRTTPCDSGRRKLCPIEEILKKPWNGKMLLTSLFLIRRCDVNLPLPGKSQNIIPRKSKQKQIIKQTNKRTTTSSNVDCKRTKITNKTRNSIKNSDEKNKNLETKA